MATVLCTGSNGGITSTRKLILEEAGHTVVAAMSSPEIIAACHDFQFHVAVIGESGHSERSLEWAALIRERCPGVKIVEIYPPHLGASLPSSDARLESPDVGAKLADRVAELSKTVPNTDQIRELCVEVLKAEKGTAFEAATRRLAAAMEQYSRQKDGKNSSTQAC